MKEVNGKMEFFYQFSDDSPKVSIILSPTSSLGEVLEQFEKFLLAAGYYFKGNLDILEDVVISEGTSSEELN